MKQNDFHVAVISHKRPHNVEAITKLIGPCTFYVNTGEEKDYYDTGAKRVIECGDNICKARNRAIQDAHDLNLPSIQVSDDLKSIKIISIVAGKAIVEPISFEGVVKTMLNELQHKKYFYGGVAVSSNRLNYTGTDVSYDKLIVNDLICLMPGSGYFDENVALKEDYDMVIEQLLTVGGVVRLNNILCDFPHRENKGGANTYRDSKSEQDATMKLYAKRGNLIQPHKTRQGQISLNYAAISGYNANQKSLF